MKTRVTFTADQMKEIHLAIEDAEHPASAALTTAWRLIVGCEEWDALKPGELVVWDWAIPRDQWTQIAQWLLDAVPATAIGRVNYAFDWMNLGPSGEDA